MPSDAKGYTKPHTLTAIIDTFGDVRLTLVCPYVFGERRPCLMGAEPDGRCDWYDYELGEHWSGCPASKDRTAECLNVDDTSETGCWPAEPEECDGFYVHDVGHGHEVDGCWALELISEVGWDDAVVWNPKVERQLKLPAEVSVDIDEDGITLSLWDDTSA